MTDAADYLSFSSGYGNRQWPIKVNGTDVATVSGPTVPKDCGESTEEARRLRIICQDGRVGETKKQDEERKRTRKEIKGVQGRRPLVHSGVIMKQFGQMTCVDPSQSIVCSAKKKSE